MSKDYEVGYGRPPQATRFKQGQSGNPNGRPKGARNFATEIDTELNARVTVTENGKQKKVTKRKLVAKQLVNKAAQGDHKATGLLLQQERTVQGEPSGAPGTPIEFLPEDESVIANIIRRIRAADEEAEALEDGDEP